MLLDLIFYFYQKIKLKHQHQSFSWCYYISILNNGLFSWDFFLVKQENIISCIISALVYIIFVSLFFFTFMYVNVFPIVGKMTTRRWRPSPNLCYVQDNVLFWWFIYLVQRFLLISSFSVTVCATDEPVSSIGFPSILAVIQFYFSFLSLKWNRIISCVIVCFLLSICFD